MYDSRTEIHAMQPPHLFYAKCFKAHVPQAKLTLTLMESTSPVPCHKDCDCLTPQNGETYSLTWTMPPHEHLASFSNIDFSLGFALELLHHKGPILSLS